MIGIKNEPQNLPPHLDKILVSIAVVESPAGGQKEINLLTALVTEGTDLLVKEKQLC